MNSYTEDSDPKLSSEINIQDIIRIHLNESAQDQEHARTSDQCHDHSVQIEKEHE